MKKSAAAALTAALALLLTACAAPGSQKTARPVEQAMEQPAGQPAENLPVRPASRRVTGQEAMDLMAKETDFLIVDVRTEGEYAEGHIRGAVLLPNETIGAETVGALPNKDQLLFVYCRSGNRSRQAAQKLVGLGYTNVVDFGGVNTWPGDLVTE